MKNTISFVFSFRNEAENIPELVKRIDKEVNKKLKLKYNMFFVNDNSTDESEKVLLKLQKK